jgi:hypothetical protein
MKQLTRDQDLALREYIADHEDDFVFQDATDGIGEFEDYLFEDVSFVNGENVCVVIDDCVVSVDATKAESILKAANSWKRG